MSHSPTRLTSSSASGRHGGTPRTGTRARISRQEAKQLKAIIRRLHEARTERALGSRELSVAAELSTGTVSALECGHITRVEMLTLIRLARALNVELAWLTAGKGPMNAEPAAEVAPASASDAVEVSDGAEASEDAEGDESSSEDGAEHAA